MTSFDFQSRREVHVACWRALCGHRRRSSFRCFGAPLDQDSMLPELLSLLLKSRSCCQYEMVWAERLLPRCRRCLSTTSALRDRPARPGFGLKAAVAPASSEYDDRPDAFQDHQDELLRRKRKADSKLRHKVCRSKQR